MSTPSTRRRIGLLGGTFDPPHLGHLVVAEEARVELGLDEVVFLPAGDPWMKAEPSAREQRLDLLEAALAGTRDLRIDDRELLREGATYTYETLVELRAEHPDVDWFFLLGEDAALQLPQWHRGVEALSLATFVVVTRPGYDLQLPAEIFDQVRRLDVPGIDISSTDLRARFAAGRAVTFQVPSGVERYVRRRGLYGATT